MKDTPKEGESVNHPQVLDGTNYACYKARRCAFLKSVYMTSWKAILNGWSPHTVFYEEGFVIYVNPEKDWDDA